MIETVNYPKGIRTEIIVWFFLISLTLASWWLGHNPDHWGAAIVTSTILVITFFKIRLVILHFMEVKRAPITLRLLFESWCFGVCGVLIYIFCFFPSI